MLERNQLKTQGLRYARSLLMVFKTVSMFSAEHTAANGPFQQSFDHLNALVKATGQFTIGFVDQRVMLNNILTTEKALAALENEFLKRGIGALTFQAGMTLASYKRAMGVLAKPAKVMEEAGGLMEYLELNPVEFIRVFPANKNQVRTESGDTFLETDSESFLVAKAMAEANAGNPFDNFEKILQQAGVGPGSGGGQGPGGGYGPGGGPGDGYGDGSGTGIGSGNGGTGSGTGYGSGTGTGGSGDSFASGTGGGGGTGGAATEGGGPRSIMQMVENYFESSTLPGSQPQKSYIELARLIKDMRPEFVLQSFPPERREELRQLPPEQMATEIIEDSAVKWAVNRLQNALPGQEAVIVEEEVVAVLLRSMQASQAAERLARKLAQYVQDVNLPKTTVDRIQDELKWVIVPATQKTAQLLKIVHYTTPEFRRMIEHIKALIKQQDAVSATQLASHYFEIFDPAAIQPPLPEELSRVPEILRTMAPVRTEFWQLCAERMISMLGSEAGGEFLHTQVVSALVTLARSVGIYEDFALIERIGTAFEKLSLEMPEQHSGCCGKALTAMMTGTAVERSIEIFVQKKDDRAWAKSAALLIRWTGQQAIGKLFQALEDEPTAANRMAMLRLIGRIGKPAQELARQRLQHERWYVVRNAVKLLAELKDPELLTQLGPVLGHPEPRVQKAALVAVMESRLPDRGLVLAEALPHLHLELLEEALGELRFLKDPRTLPALEQFVFRDAHGNTQAMLIAVQALSVMPGEHCESLLLHILQDDTLEISVRRQALTAMLRFKSEFIRAGLQEFVTHSRDNSLVAECKRGMAASGL